MGTIYVTITLSFLASLGLAAPHRVERQDLATDKMVEISFGRIPKTLYSNIGSTLKMEVDKSSSAYIKAFKEIREVRGLSVRWKHQGTIVRQASQHEMARAGDDFLLRIGFMTHGKAPWIPFIAPAWIRLIRDTLRFPTSKMIYFVFGSKQVHGHRWESPSSSAIENVALTSRSEGEVNMAEYEFQSPLSTVGLWVMADGDDTQSQFVTVLDQLDLLF